MPIAHEHSILIIPFIRHEDSSYILLKHYYYVLKKIKTDDNQQVGIQKTEMPITQRKKRDRWHGVKISIREGIREKHTQIYKSQRDAEPSRLMQQSWPWAVIEE